METFEKHNISFVSVTQQFNTTHSMGRLTLNILLSFAQFEREIIGDRKSVLIFASGIRHGQHMVETLKKQHGVECGFVTGETLTTARDLLLERFKSGELQFLCNVNVLTTGFGDHAERRQSSDLSPVGRSRLALHTKRTCPACRYSGQWRLHRRAAIDAAGRRLSLGARNGDGTSRPVAGTSGMAGHSFE
jgi:hypothetical protein